MMEIERELLLVGDGQAHLARGQGRQRQQHCRGAVVHHQRILRPDQLRPGNSASRAAQAAWRTVLSLSLEVEIEGRFPWQRARG